MGVFSKFISLVESKGLFVNSQRFRSELFKVRERIYPIAFDELYPQNAPKAPQIFKVLRQNINPFRFEIDVWLHDIMDATPQAIFGLPNAVWDVNPRPDIVYSVEKWYRAGIRAGNACAKTRSEVSGSNAKGRPQKGTGRARMGCKRAPHMRKGGKSHGPRPRNFEYELGDSCKHAAMRVALSHKLRRNELFFVADDAISSVQDPDAFCRTIDAFKATEKKILFIDNQPPTSYPAICKLAEDRSNLLTYFNAVFDEKKEASKKRTAQRHIPYKLRRLNAYHVLCAHKVFITQRAAFYLTSMLGSASSILSGASRHSLNCSETQNSLIKAT